VPRLIGRRLFADRTAENLDEAWIEHRPGLRFDDLERLGDRDRSGAWIFCGECIERLCDGHKAREIWNSFFLKRKRISGAVPAFMVQRDDLDGLRGQSDCPPNAGADIGMMAAAVTLMR
jgi:hypothetical protein